MSELRPRARYSPAASGGHPREHAAAQYVTGRVMMPPPVTDLPLEYLEGTRYQLPAELKKMAARGEVAAAGPMHHLGHGRVGVYVRRLRQPVPTWRRIAPVVALGVGAASAVTAAVVWALGALVASLAALPPVVWAMLALLVLAGGGGGTLVVVKVWVR